MMIPLNENAINPSSIHLRSAELILQRFLFFRRVRQTHKPRETVREKQAALCVSRIELNKKARNERQDCRAGFDHG
jgi:hypothetical protein